jgi:pyruvate formate-lyase activating enzyme-like uncharacterized protein
MNYERPKFLRKNPKTKEQKLICELISCLEETTIGFINLNKLTISDEELFLILRDAALGYVGETIEMLTHMFAYKEQIPEFIDETHDIFNCYLKRVRESCEQS